MSNAKNLRILILMVALVTGLLFTGCDSESTTGDDSDSSKEEGVLDVNLPSNDMDPDYDVVFNQSELMEINIVIDSDDWEAMQDDLSENISTAGRGFDDGESSFDPIWVESSITVNDITWTHVGIRFKGNSSLSSTYSSGNNKLSFKLDFDEFEDDYSIIEDQRFYGFKQLNLNNNYNDYSLMREKVGADLFREFGLVSAETAFCVVNVDYGEGSQYYGVSTLVEEMDDSGILSQFGNDSGNLYKPDGDSASFASGDYDEDELVKKNNEDEDDYSDVESLYDIINSDNRETDVDSWKAELENVFNVDDFLKWLAANTVIQNWDTYGNMTHNYYLYNNPETSQLN
ncbi:MAG: CotH kinase family protein [Peptostreptococcaceae bacterium]|nr:CotH kinase family protein [Peptostreptococcaceae bacterium]